MSLKKILCMSFFLWSGVVCAAHPRKKIQFRYGETTCTVPNNIDVGWQWRFDTYINMTDQGQIDTRVNKVKTQEEFDAICIAFRMHQNWREDGQHETGYPANFSTSMNYQDCFKNPAMTQELLKSIGKLSVDGLLAKCFASYMTIHKGFAINDLLDQYSVADIINHFNFDTVTREQLITALEQNAPVNMRPLKESAMLD